MAMKTKRFTLDGRVVDIGEFILDNKDFTKKDLRDIANLKIGDEIIYGGGAAAVFVLKRTK